MNAQNLDQNKNRLSYQKDYSKLESIFDAAVERMHRKKIIYYATDRIFSDDSRKIRAKETYKEVAWAKPLSAEDVKTEVIQLAKDNVIPISDTILNDDTSLRSILELVGEENAEIIERESQDKNISKEAPKLSSLLETNDLKKNEVEVGNEPADTVKEVAESEPLKLVEETIEKEPPEFLEDTVPIDENPLYQRYQKLREDVKAMRAGAEKTETVVTEKSPETEAVLLSDLVSDEVETTENISEEESLQETTEKILVEEDDTSEKILEEFEEFSQTIEENPKVPKDITLGELIAKIQEDNFYLYPDEAENTVETVSTSESIEPELIEETLEENSPEALVEADEMLEDSGLQDETSNNKELLTEIVLEESTEEQFEISETVESEISFEEPLKEETVEFSEQPLENFEEESLNVQERPFNTETLENKPKRRIQINEVDEQDLFEPKVETKSPKPKINQVYLDKVNSARKEYMLSRISFIVALFLTGVFTVLSFTSFTGIDYFALLLSLIGAFLVWDLKSRNILIMTVLMEALIIGSMFYQVNNTGMALDMFHYVWLLVLPLLISASFLFKKSRENYAEIIKNKDIKLSVN